MCDIKQVLCVGCGSAVRQFGVGVGVSQRATQYKVLLYCSLTEEGSTKCRSLFGNSLATVVGSECEKLYSGYFEVACYN